MFNKSSTEDNMKDRWKPGFPVYTENVMRKGEKSPFMPVKTCLDAQQDIHLDE